MCRDLAPPNLAMHVEAETHRRVEEIKSFWMELGGTVSERSNDQGREDRNEH